VNGVARRAPSLVGVLRTVLFAPEEMLLVAGSPSLRREALDRLAGQRSPAYPRDLATYGRALQQRNGLLRLIREEQAGRDELRFWDASLLEAGTAVRAERQRLLDALAAPLMAAHAEIAPDEAAAGRLGLRYATNAPQLPGETVRDALARRLVETAEKEVWNGTTLIGPHRDDVVFEMGGRDLASFASRGQQRTAILAFKLAELDLLTELDDRPPLLLLDDVFSELDPERRGPAPGIRDDNHPRGPRPRPAFAGHPVGGDGRGGRDLAARAGPVTAMSGRSDRDPESVARRRRPTRVGDLLPDAARQLGLEEELRLARAIATWDALVAERVIPAAGACRLVALEPDAIVVAADEPIVAAELRMRALELLDAFAAAPGGTRVRHLRIRTGGGAGPRG
jgi:hypothetical protein